MYINESASVFDFETLPEESIRDKSSQASQGNGRIAGFIRGGLPRASAAKMAAPLLPTWSWDKGSASASVNDYCPYAVEISKKIEECYVRMGPERFECDIGGGCVVTKTRKGLVQHVKGEPGRWRAVKRVVNSLGATHSPAPPPSPAPAAPANPAILPPASALARTSSRASPRASDQGVTIAEDGMDASLADLAAQPLVECCMVKSVAAPIVKPRPVIEVLGNPCAWMRLEHSHNPPTSRRGCAHHT